MILVPGFGPFARHHDANWGQLSLVLGLRHLNWSSFTFQDRLLLVVGLRLLDRSYHAHWGQPSRVGFADLWESLQPKPRAPPTHVRFADFWESLLHTLRQAAFVEAWARQATWVAQSLVITRARWTVFTSLMESTDLAPARTRASVLGEYCPNPCPSSPHPEISPFSSLIFLMLFKLIPLH